MSTPEDATHTADAGPDAFFENGVLEFSGKLRSFIRARVRNPQDVEDIAQDVILKVFKAKNALRDPAKLEAWLYQTTRSAIIDHWRRSRPNEELPASLADEPRGFDEVGNVLKRSALRFLQTLPVMYRQPLEMAELQGLKVAEIASRLGLSVTAIKSRLQRGRDQLRTRMISCCDFEYDTSGKVIDFTRKPVPCGCPAGDSLPAREACCATLPAVSIDLAQEQEGPSIIALLRENRLLTEDLIGGHFLNFVTARSQNKLLGCAGIEVHETLGLLRSVAVSPGLHGLGLGTRLLERTEFLARQLGLTDLYLLTTTAPAFFSRHGYACIERSLTPEPITRSREFSSLCPSSAIVMRKSFLPAGKAEV